jgi:hypothetical protein
MIRKGQVRWVAGNDLPRQISSSTVFSIWQPEHMCPYNNLSPLEGCNTTAP